jgi:hypothetical protein
MLLYDWKKIFIIAAGQPSSIFTIFEMLVKDSIPRNKYDPIYRYYQLDFKGDSFLVHPDVLLYNSFRHSRRDISIYLALASMRSLGEYFASGDTTLGLLELPIDPFEHLDNTEDRLLYIEDDKLHFLYEEVPQEKTQWH